MLPMLNLQLKLGFGTEMTTVVYFFLKKNKGNVTANPLKDENFSMGFN
jgi:hypothetical protein